MTRAARGLDAGLSLLLGFAVGGTVFILAPASLGLGLRLTLGWVAGVSTYLVLALVAIGDGSVERARARARPLDVRAWIVFALTIAAAAASLAALGFQLQKPAGASAQRLGLACVAVLASWLMAHTCFALHYAHIYYGDAAEGGWRCRRRDRLSRRPAPRLLGLFLLCLRRRHDLPGVGRAGHLARDAAADLGPMACCSFFFNTGVLALAVNIVASSL